tara:strand:- start:71 stop:2440 length:2370 start_codon:yes stop_codon:yes gene_type:complete
MSGIGTIPYIKISRTDGNGIDITNSLSALSSIVLPLSTGNKTFTILNRTKEAEYFLFYVSTTGTENIPAIDKSSPEYIFTGSMDNGTFTFSGGVGSSPIKIPISSSTVDNLNFYDSSLGGYVIKTLNAKKLHFRVSGSIDVGNLTNKGRIGVYLNDSFVTQTSLISNGSSQAVDLQGSIDINATPGSLINVRFSDSDNLISSASFNSGAKFFISSSNAVANPKDMSVEPYFTSLYYGTDCDVMYGDINRAVSNPFLQDVDYSEGIIVPTNYIALRDNTATKATVPESTFTINSLINPGYGSKNQSEKINEWTNSLDNIGTFGKTPSIDSLKSLVVYSDWIGGNTPEKHGSCAAHIQYIINEDGTINEPNLLDTSVGNIQQAFESNQNLIINLTDPPIAQGMEVLNGIQPIDKGGYRIEPILYTQSGSLYNEDGNVYFTGSSLVGSTLGSGSIDDFSTNAIMSANQTISDDNITFNTVNFNTQTQTPTPSNPYNTSNARYTVPVGAVNDGITLNFQVLVLVISTSTNSYYLVNPPRVRVRLINLTTGNVIATKFEYIDVQTGTSHTPLLKEFGLVATVSNPTEGDVYEVQIRGDAPDLEINFNGQKPNGTNWTLSGAPYFRVYQIPAPDGGTFNVGNNSIWGYASTSDFSVITASQAALNNSYGIYKQVDIPNSGFKNISETWSVKPGDEFRFEDREDRVFMVQSVVSPNSHPSGTLEVQLDKPIPTASINLDHFLIRRYVPDGSFILFNESKPSGNTGPSLIKPQFVTQTLTKGVDEYIVDLTSKGLIS